MKLRDVILNATVATVVTFGVAAIAIVVAALAVGSFVYLARFAPAATFLGSGVVLVWALFFWVFWKDG